MQKNEIMNAGLYGYGFRDYSPVSARFTTIDPIRDGNNWFSYCMNDAVNYVDYLGLTPGFTNNTSKIFIVIPEKDEYVSNFKDLIKVHLYCFRKQPYYKLLSLVSAARKLSVLFRLRDSFHKFHSRDS